MGWRCGLSLALPLSRGSSTAFHTTVPPPHMSSWPRSLAPGGWRGTCSWSSKLSLFPLMSLPPRRFQSLSQSYQSSLTDPCSVCPLPLCCSDHLSLQQGMGTAGAPASWFAEATGRGGSAVTQPRAPGRRKFPSRIGEAASEGPHRASVVLSRGGQEKPPRKPPPGCPWLQPHSIPFLDHFLSGSHRSAPPKFPPSPFSQADLKVSVAVPSFRSLPLQWLFHHKKGGWGVPPSAPPRCSWRSQETLLALTSYTIFLPPIWGCEKTTLSSSPFLSSARSPWV